MNSLSGCNEKIDGDWHDVEKLELSYFAGGKVKCKTMVWPFFQNKIVTIWTRISFLMIMLK